MDSLFEILIVLFFLLIPFLEAIFKRRKEGEGPPGEDEEAAATYRSPGTQAPGRGERAAGTAGVDVAGPGADQETSEGMIPPEIWEELTGMPHPHTEAPAPGPEAPPANGGRSDDEVAWWEEEKAEKDEAGEPSAASAGEEISAGEIQPGATRADEITRREPREVSAEEAELARRFERAQARAAPSAAPPVPGGVLLGAGTEGGSGRARRLLAGASRRRLRDAILLKEILGPPVALRDDDSGGAG